MARSYARKKFVVIAACVVGALSLIAPIALSINFADKKANELQFDRLTLMAEEIIRRSEITREQTQKAVSTILDSKLETCSDEQISLLRETAIGSTYLSIIGIVHENRLFCSSLGRHADGIDIGPGDKDVVGGIRRIGIVNSDISKDVPVNIYEWSGVAVILHPQLVFDILDKYPEISAATLLLEPVHVTRSRGKIKDEWIDRGRNDSKFDDGDYFVVTRRSGLSVVIVAVPKSSAKNSLAELAVTRVPIGILFGLILACAVYLISRQLLSLKSELRLAIKREDLFLAYQPIMELDSGLCIGAEALVRWQQADGTIIRPDIFIPFAMENGMIRDITRYVLKTVAKDASTILHKHPNFHLGVNLSAEDLHTEETVAFLSYLTKHSDLKACNLVIEATESGFLEKGYAQEVIEQIRSLGIKVAIDDFGTGYSSLSSLQSLSLDYLKIDKSFVETMNCDSATSMVATHIIEMAKSLNLMIVAEGIETSEQLKKLKELGVEFGQGWLFGKPMSLMDFFVFAENNKKQASSFQSN